MNKLEYIQFFRGIAILLVILAHTTHHNISGDIGIKFLDNLVWFGGHGVTLFFIVSAFTIFYANDNLKSLSAFYLKRVFRIVPIYYLGILFYYYIFHQNKAFDYKLILNIFLLNWMHPQALESVVPGGWSISTEFTFYLLAPLLLFHIKDFKTALRVFLVSILASRVAVTILSSIYPDADAFYLVHNPLGEFPVFVIGIMLFMIVIKKDVFVVEKLDFLLIFVIVFLESIVGFVLRDIYLVGLGFSLLIYSASNMNFKKYFSSIFFIGEISYSLYVSHFYVSWQLKNWGVFAIIDNSILSWIVRFITTLLVSIAICIPLHFLFEKPLQLFGKKLAKTILK